MRTVFLLSIVLFVFNIVLGQNLSPGDIALIGANCDNPDDFAFLALVDIPSGMQIKFTDNGWSSSTNSFRTGEGILIFTASSNISAGTTIVYSNNSADFSSGGGSFALSTSGDQILVYQGDESSPSFVFALNIKGNPGQWQADATNSNESALPPGLVNGETAVAVDEYDNVKYNGTTIFSSPSAALSAICDKNNWIGDNANRYDFTTFGDFSLPVTLSSFQALAQDGHVLLKWRTESEIDNLGFEIYRSLMSAEGYSLIDSYRSNPQLRGQLSSSASKDYQYLDETVSAGQTYYYKLADVDLKGQRTFHGPVKVQVEENPLQPIASSQTIKDFRLHPAFPNPFNPSTTITFDVPPSETGQSDLSLQIFNVQGQQVKTLFSGSLQANAQYRLKWDGSNELGQSVPAGIYFVLLKTKGFLQSQKICVIK